eukprot:TRINITY_DN67530_c2_g1_i1.p1 TRINITY_DN67530_c2_g1~~TRINITY_DN67530_c2_g1_i1.p1  ORF type:complete len:715 (-),score=50.68 TRINITY_DN67530_c2_g1_i1:261-2405(-)
MDNQGHLDLDKWDTPTLELGYQKLGMRGAEQVAEGLATTDMVRYLGLAGNNLTDEAIKIIVAGLELNRSVEILDLTDNQIKDEGAKALAAALRVNNTLGSLILEDNKIRRAGGEAIANALRKSGNRKLRKLNLANNRIREGGAVALANMLKENETLNALNVSRNEINSAGAVALAEGVAVNSSLQSLDLSYNLIGAAVGAWGTGLTQNSTLLELNLEKCLIGADDAREMSIHMLKVSLLSLNLSYNNITDKGMQPLLDCFKDQSSMRYLDLSCTGIGIASMDELAHVLKLCPSLETLHVDNNNLKREGVSVLCGTIKNNQSLTSLNLDKVEMDQVGVISLSLALQNNPWFTSLSLCGNQIGDEGCHSLCYPLKRMTMLNTVNLGQNRISADCIEQLSAIFVNNPKLNQIPLQGNPIAEHLVNGVLSRRTAQKTLDAVLDKSSLIVAPTPLQHRQQSTALGMSTGGGGGSGLPPIRPGSPSVVGGQSTSSTALSNSLSPLQTSQVSTGTLTQLAMTTPKSSLLFPEARAATILASADALQGEEEERQNGTYPPLIPNKSSLEDPYYPGFGKGVFSNSVSIAATNSVIPYTMVNSLGPQTPVGWHPSAPPQGVLQTAVVRKVHKVNPYSERALENNIGGLLVTKKRLWQAFQELDIDGNGYLDREEFKALYATFDNYGVEVDEDEIEKICGQYKLTADGKLTFDEFCLMMCKVAQR